jgi:hypothetical protein
MIINFAVAILDEFLRAIDFVRASNWRSHFACELSTGNRADSNVPLYRHFLLAITLD